MRTEFARVRRPATRKMASGPDRDGRNHRNSSREVSADRRLQGRRESAAKQSVNPGKNSDRQKSGARKVGKMSSIPNTRQGEVEANLQAFLAALPKIANEHRGKYALLHNGEIVGYYDTPVDAVSAGNLKYSDRMFSIQHVTDVAVDLGYYSHAGHMGSAQ
jgi:hypothetical protein